MVGKRLIPLFLAATIFLLQGADCVSLFFADQQSRDCCQKGHCNRKNPDPCCQVSTKVDLTQVQAKDKVQLAVPARKTRQFLAASPSLILPLGSRCVLRWSFLFFT